MLCPRPDGIPEVRNTDMTYRYFETTSLSGTICRQTKLPGSKKPFNLIDRDMNDPGQLFTGDQIPASQLTRQLQPFR